MELFSFGKHRINLGQFLNVAQSMFSGLLCSVLKDLWEKRWGVGDKGMLKILIKMLIQESPWMLQTFNVSNLSGTW